MPKKHTICALVENHFGVLAGWPACFPVEDTTSTASPSGKQRILKYHVWTIVVRGDDRVLEQVVKQLNRLIDVIQVIDITQGAFIERELALVKVKATPATRSEIIQIAEVFRANIVDVSTSSMTIEATGKRGQNQRNDHDARAIRHQRNG